jgi:flagellar basal body rod protein FlgG
MVAVEDRQAVIANNIANAATVGFRRQEAVQEGFYGVFANKLVSPGRFNRSSAPGGGAKVVETSTSTAAGPIVTTDDPLNVALRGPGFLAVNAPDGERFTRAGNFLVDGDGELATPDGYKVQGEGGGGIEVPPGNVEIMEDGSLKSNGVTSGRLRIVEFEDPHMLARLGEGLYGASPEALARSADATKTDVIGKSLEMSNVNIPKEMVSMILALRAYGANQKVISAFSETMSAVIERVGMPA